MLRTAPALVAVLALTACASSVSEMTPTTPPADASPSFTPIPERESTVLFVDEFDDDGNGWLAAQADSIPSEAATLAGGTLTFASPGGETLYGLRTGSSGLGALDNSVTTLNVNSRGHAFVGILCHQSDTSPEFVHNSWYALTTGPGGTRIARGELDGTFTDLFTSLAPGFEDGDDIELTLSCWREDDGLHLDVLVDSEIIAQAIDPDPLPAGTTVLFWQGDPAFTSEGRRLVLDRIEIGG